MLCNLVDFKGIYAVLARIEICREIRVFVLILGLKYSSVLFCTLFPSLHEMFSQQLIFGFQTHEHVSILPILRKSSSFWSYKIFGQPFWQNIHLTTHTWMVWENGGWAEYTSNWCCLLLCFLLLCLWPSFIVRVICNVTLCVACSDLPVYTNTDVG